MSNENPPVLLDNAYNTYWDGWCTRAMALEKLWENLRSNENETQWRFRSALNRRRVRPQSESIRVEEGLELVELTQSSFGRMKRVGLLVRRGPRLDICVLLGENEGPERRG